MRWFFVVLCGSLWFFCVLLVFFFLFNFFFFSKEKRADESDEIFENDETDEREKIFVFF